MIFDGVKFSTTELSEIAEKCCMELDEAVYLEEIGVIKKEADGSYDIVGCMSAVFAHTDEEIKQMSEIQRNMR